MAMRSWSQGMGRPRGSGDRKGGKLTGGPRPAPVVGAGDESRRPETTGAARCGPGLGWQESVHAEFVLEVVNVHAPLAETLVTNQIPVQRHVGLDAIDD